MLPISLLQVCPAGWKPGADTIIPDPKEKMKYFKNHGEL
jgi:alkyl hydroperoxide reductase subunit AhpC